MSDPAAPLLLGILVGTLTCVAESALPASAADSNLPPTTSILSGKALYEEKCSLCHEKDAIGSAILAKRLGAVKSVLADRSDLAPLYVKSIVRQGIGGMPFFTKVELTDKQLDAIAVYLAHDSGKSQ
jgi:mono/diheme cytochrome c family protein